METFAGRVQVSRSGEVRVLEPGEQPGSPQDSVVLADPGPMIAFPFFPDSREMTRWRSFRDCMPDADESIRTVHVYSHVRDDVFLADGQWRNAASFAAALVDAGLSQYDPRAPLRLMVELSAASRQHLATAREVARLLRGDGPYREVTVNTGPLRINPITGSLNFASAGFERVSEVLITDVHWEELVDGIDQTHGAALLGDTSRYRGLRKGARFADDHSMRLARVAPDVDGPYANSTFKPLPWASSIEAGRARPFVIHLEGQGRSYAIRLHDGRVYRLSAQEMARLLASPAFRRALADPRVRRPVVLVTRMPLADDKLNLDLFDLLARHLGARPYYGYSGPMRYSEWTEMGRFLGSESTFAVPRGSWFIAGPPLIRHNVSVQWHAGVFTLTDAADLEPDVVDIAQGVARGEFGDAPWGDQSPLVVAVHSREGYAVVPTTDGGHVELEGQDAFHVLSADEDFDLSLKAPSGRPVVLVGEDAGTRVNPGGFGFDFASVLHEVKDFRDVYAMTRDERGRPVFRLVSGLRDGDVALEPLENSEGQTVAVVVRSAGDEAEVEKAREWAHDVTPEKMKQFWNTSTGRFEDSPWSTGRPPLTVLVTRRGEQYLAARSDDETSALSMDGLTGVLRDSELLRNTAGFRPDVDFVFAALGGESVEPVGFGAGMLAGGYSRRVHWPAGRLAFRDDGHIAVEGDGFRTVDPVEPGIDDFITYPMFKAGTGEVDGQVYPSKPGDVLWMPSSGQRRKAFRFKHYIRKTTTRAADGTAERREEKLPIPGSKSPVSPWYIAMHGQPDKVAVRLRTGRPHRFGDLLMLSPQDAGRVLTLNEIYRSAPHPRGEEKVALACSINRAPDDGGHPLASYLVEAFEQADGFPVTVRAADEVLETHRITGRWSIRDGGSFRRAVPPGGQVVDSSDEHVSDTDFDFDSEAETDAQAGADVHSGVEVSFGAVAPAAVSPEAVERVVLRDGLGGVVGAGFLAGGEAGVVVEAFASGAGVPGVFSVVAHRGPDGVRLPLESGGFGYLGDRAFVRLLVGMRLFAPDVPVRFLMCGVTDSGALRDELRRLGHVGGVETFAGRVRVSRSGEVRVLEPDEQPGPSQDSVVLADPGLALAFPFTPGGPDGVGWEFLHSRMPATPQNPQPVHVYAHTFNGRLFVNGQWQDGASFAAALVDAGFSRQDPRTPLHLMIELITVGRQHVEVAREVARVLRGDGPYREVFVNTAPLRVDPQTGSVEVMAARFERVSDLLITDVEWTELIDGDGRLHGAAVLGDASDYRGLRKGARFLDDHNMRLARISPNLADIYRNSFAELLPWASSIGAGRARPFVLHLESAGSHYVVQSKEGSTLRLSVREMARLLLSPAFHRALTDPRVRRPLVLITRTATPNSALNRELLDLLMKEIGVRVYHEYSGPLVSRQVMHGGEVAAEDPSITLPLGGRFTSGPASMKNVVSVRRDGDVFALADDAHLGAELVDVVQGVARGAFGDRPWGEVSPLVVAVRSAEGHAIVPTVDGGRFELGGQEVFYALSEDEHFLQVWVGEPGRPVVLVGEDAGTRLDHGGFGFDFASVLHEVKDFRDVYAMTRDERGRPVFRLVSGLRGGDVALEPLRNLTGHVVAVVVRSAGDEAEVERARRWASNVTVPMIRQFWNTSAGRFEDAPWSTGRPPLLVLATRRGEHYLATRSDGTGLVLSVDGVTGALADSLLFRRTAGTRPDVDLVFASLGDASVEPVGFGRGMLAGGYSRLVHWPAGRLVLLNNGRIAVEGDGFRTAEKITLSPDDIVTYPMFEAGTGRLNGHFHPASLRDVLGMQAMHRYEASFGFKRYIREVVGQRDVDGAVVRGYEKLPMKWLKGPVPPWYVAVHGQPNSVSVRLRTRRPHQLGDELGLPSEAAAQVLTRNSIYRSASHPRGEQKVATVCLINQTPAGGGHPLASYLVGAFEQADGFPVTVWAADQVVGINNVTGRRSVLKNGFYRKAVRPGDEAVDSADEDFSDTDAEFDFEADPSTFFGAVASAGVRVSPRDVERVVLRDGLGGVVGAGFLAGGE
ncbi:hypothetical protein AB0G02_26005, partial [Actinosynnema sp. NPDC023658]|uniref:hypothetical protein n=1 Tax=Actinosynnema sp. NPDC023658 TaxID=3155465 RepID=UPI0033F4CE37